MPDRNLPCPVDALPWYLNLDAEPWTAYGTVPHVTLDFETTNLDHGDPRTPGNRLVDAALQMNGTQMICGVQESLRQISTLSSEPVILVAHNAKFELGWLEREGIETRNMLPWDTMIAEYVLAGNRPWPLDLDSVAKRYGLAGKGRLVDALMKGGVCPSEMPTHLLRERVIGDCTTTTSLFYSQRLIMEAQGLTRVMFSRCIVTPVLARMEPVGMRLDPERVAAEHEALLQKRRELEISLTTLSGGRNLRSGKQMAELLYKELKFQEPSGARGEPLRTLSGRPRTDGHTLMMLKATTPEQREFVKLRSEYGKVDAALTKTVDFLSRVCAEKGGEFVASFNQCRTRTHRLSSSGKRVSFSDGSTKGIQFQNLPVEYKRLFVARTTSSGMPMLMVEADGSQLEFRVAGSLARDPQILRDTVTGADVHRYTAAILNHLSETEVSARQRNAAKPDTFKPMYGGMSGTPRQKAYYEAFRQKYSTLFQVQTGWTMGVLREGQLRTATGLTFHWPGTSMSRSGYVDNSSAIFNYPIQSLATAEIIPVSLVYLFWRASATIPNVRFVNTVHDSVLAEVPQEGLDKYREIVVQCFLDRTYEYMSKVYGIDLYVPLGVSIKAGTHWGDGEEFKVSYPAKGREEGAE